MNTRAIFRIALLSVIVLVSNPGPADDETTSFLRVSHQWPGNTGDIRDEMVRIITNAVNAADVGLEMKIFPDKKLFKPREQWSAMVTGLLDISVFPLAYAGTHYAEFNLTLMPGIIKDHDHARRFNRSEVMSQIKRIINSAGVVVLADTWLAGGIASRSGCIREPRDVHDKWMRGAGTTFNQMLKGAGAKIASMPSSDILKSFRAKEAQGAITSSSSLVSFRIYEESNCLTAPQPRALWFMYEPILMSKDSYEKLTSRQRDVLEAAAQESEEYAYEAAKKADNILIETYEKAGVKIVEMSERQFQKWIDLAEDTSYRIFREEIPGGASLLEKARSVE